MSNLFYRSNFLFKKLLQIWNDLTNYAPLLFDNNSVIIFWSPSDFVILHMQLEKEFNYVGYYMNSSASVFSELLMSWVLDMNHEGSPSNVKPSHYLDYRVYELC